MTDTPRRSRPRDYFEDWKQREELAESMIPMIGQLYRRNIKTYIYGTPLINISVLDIMRAHREVRQVESNELSEFETYPVLKALLVIQQQDNLGYAHIDIGRISNTAMQMGLFSHNDGVGEHSIAAQAKIDEFTRKQVEALIGKTTKPLQQPQDIVLYGFGRIGRLLARVLVEKTGGGGTLRLRAVVVRPGAAPRKDLAKRADLLRRDSVHGPFKGTIREDEEMQSLVVNGNTIKLIYAQQPDEIDYEQYGISNAIVVDNTGAWRDRQGLSRHLKSKGVAKVLLTAPGKDIKNIVHGINHHLLDENEQIVSAASCTTNAIAPALRSLNDKFGIRKGHIETVHAYTNDQNLIDNYHSANRRGRSAALNLVLTSTGAAKALSKILPELEGKLTGSAMRVPVPNVSMAILFLSLREPASVENINEHMRQAAMHSDLRKQIGYTNSPEVVSSDFIGSRQACVFDSQATQVNGNDQCAIYLWYDNEFGYSCQAHRLLEEMAGVCYQVCPSQA